MELFTTRRGRGFFLTVAILAVILLYGISSHTLVARPHWDQPEEASVHAWNAAQNNPAQPIQPNEAIIRLHPKDHIHRPAARLELEWNITKAYLRPDGVLKKVYLINGRFPGPSVEARSGDEIVVTVRNHLEADEGIAIHWHGLRIANEMDGVAGLTQPVIEPGCHFSYRLALLENQSGTFWYHSHAEDQRADGLFGSFTVHKPLDPSDNHEDEEDHAVDEEQVLLVGDWYHRSAPEILDAYRDWTLFKIEPAPDSILLNGKGSFNCSMALRARPLDCEASTRPHLLLRHRRTKVRIINTGALVGLSVSTTGYSMTLVQVDGGHAVSAVHGNSLGVLYPGERVDVIFDQQDDVPADMRAIKISLDGENMQFPNLALTAVQDFAIRSHSAAAASGQSQVQATTAQADETDHIRLTEATAPQNLHPLLTSGAEETVLIYATISYLTQFEYRPKAFMNNTSWTLASSLQNPLLALGRDDWPTDPSPFAPTVQEGNWIDLVVNNIDEKGHPFHLHGHDFYVLKVHKPSRVGAYEAYNPFDPNREPAGGPANVVDPVMKDTIYIPGRGYAVLRFKADNPGLWLLHCHVLWHQSVGMTMIIEVADSASSQNALRKKIIDPMCTG